MSFFDAGGSGPQRGDTYARGNRVEVWVLFDEHITLSWSGGGPPPVTLALGIGAATRHATVHGCISGRPGASRCGGPVGGISFIYDVREGIMTRMESASRRMLCG